MDEATSALDNETEAMVVESFSSLPEDVANYIYRTPALITSTVIVLSKFDRAKSSKNPSLGVNQSSDIRYQERAAGQRDIQLGATDRNLC